jgi:hypothetical protein
MKPVGVAVVLSASLLMGACVSVPTGPSIMALPGTSKTTEQFRDDDWFCRNFANDHIGGVEPAEVARSGTAKGAAAGAAIGAGLGAAFGGGGGAAIGASFGLLAGVAVGASSGESSARALQQRYDQAYVQCMYGKGHRVPVVGRLTSTPQRSYAPPPPPPPPGAPPPPPPR